MLFISAKYTGEFAIFGCYRSLSRKRYEIGTYVVATEG